jgi:hypothetical protein
MLSGGRIRPLSAQCMNYEFQNLGLFTLIQSALFQGPLLRLSGRYPNGRVEQN